MSRTVTSSRIAGLRLRRRLKRGRSEALRLNHVANAYRAALLRYRPDPYDGPAFLLASIEIVRHLGKGHWLDRSLVNRTLERLEFHHLDLQTEPDALFAWTSRLSQLIRDVEDD